MRILNIIVLAAVLGCGEPVAPEPPMRAVLLLLPADREQVSPTTPPVVTASGGHGGVAVRGTFLTPCAAKSIGVSVVRGGASGSELGLTLRYQYPPFCARITVPLRYEVLVTGLRPGTYQLSVFHEGDVQPGGDPTLATQVEVRGP